jgi:Flp pilus assembly protein TadB
VTLHDVMAIAAGALFLLWWWPEVQRNEPAPTSSSDWNEARGLRYLVANSSTSQTFTQSLTALEEISDRQWCTNPELSSRVSALNEMNSEFGIPVTIPLQQLHFEVDTSEILQRMWSEKAAVAYTSSNALIFISLAMTVVSGSLSWLVSDSIGIACVVVSLFLIILARRIINFMKSQALRTSPVSHRSPRPMFAVWVLSLGVVAVMPSALGLAGALVLFVGLKTFLSALPQSRALRHAEQLFVERDWFLSLVHSSTVAGHDWLKSFEIAGPHMSSAMQSAVESVVTRLRWGLPATEALTDSLWSEVGQIARQVQQLGIKADVALTNLRLDLNHTHRSRRISKLEKYAAKAVIPVSLLQLPAFILIGIVPVIASQFADLLKTFGPLMA